MRRPPTDVGGRRQQAELLERDSGENKKRVTRSSLGTVTAEAEEDSPGVPAPAPGSIAPMGLDGKLALSLGQNFRSFTLLLDLKFDYQKRFLHQLRSACSDFGLWKELQNDASLQKLGVDAFVSKYGDEYWGEKNRERYLLPSKDPEDVIKYPEMAAE
jgi:hypothetical protein